MATTINSYSVGLTLDAADYINKAALSGQETRRLMRAIEESRTPAEKYGREIDRLTKAVDVGAISLDVYGRLLSNAGKKYGMVSQDTKAAADEQELLARTMKEGEQVTKSVMTAEERHRAELSRLSNLYKENAISAETYRRAVVQLTAQTDGAKASLQQQNRLMSEGKQVTQAMLSPTEKFRTELQRLGELYRSGAISASTYKRAVADANPATQAHNKLLEEGRRITVSLLSPMEKHERSLRSLNQLHKAGAIDAVTYRRGIQQAEAELKKLTATTDKAAKTHSVLGSQIKSIAAGYVGIQTLTKSIQLAIGAEQAAAAFEVLTGSINNASILLTQMRSFSDASPLSFVGVQDAAKTMLAFSVPLQDVMRNLKMLGDISLGNEERFRLLTLAFSQMTAAGRLSGQDLLQFVNAGFNPLQEISKRTGESLVELRDRMGEGAIASAEVTQAFIDATSEGGKFNGMTEKLADTMGGRLAIAMADVEKAGISLGNSFEPLISALTDGFNEGNSAINVFIGLVEKAVDGIGAMGAIVVDVAKNIASLGNRGDERFSTFENWLDRISKRDEERKQKLYEEAYKRTLPSGSSFDVEAAKSAVVSRAGADMTEDFNKQISKLQNKITIEQKGVEVARKLELAAKGYNAIQIQQIVAQESYLKKLEEQENLQKKIAADKEKAAKDREKEIERLKKAADEAFSKDIENALVAANQHFEKQREQNKRLREQMSQGIGGTYETGTAEAFNFFRDQQRTAIGAAAVPELPTPGEEEIINKAKELFEIEQKTRAEQHKQQIAAAEAVRRAILENGFQRIR